MGVPKGLDGVTCQACGVEVDDSEGARLLEVEAKIETKLAKLEARKYFEMFNEDRAKSLLKELGPVGPQHYHIWEHLQRWYATEDRREDQRRMLELRVRYQRKAYSGLSGALA